MAFDFKKEYKEYYLPPRQPQIILIPPMNFIAVPGQGDPNAEGGAYQQAISILYSLAFTLKMSYKGGRRIQGFFEYVVPPLEGFWWQQGVSGIDYAHKETYNWISLIRLPDFITPTDLEWAREEAERKKKIDLSAAQFLTYDEGLCVQCMHIGSYDHEPVTVARMEQYARERGYVNDIGDQRYHHEIYLSDARRCEPDKLKTVIRHPLRQE